MRLPAKLDRCKRDTLSTRRNRRFNRARRILFESLEHRALLAAGLGAPEGEAVAALPNAQPSFTASDPPAVLEDAPTQTINGFATFDPGDPSESSQQVLAYQVSDISNPDLFETAPAIDNDGNLTYTPAANAFGTSTIEVTVQDDGGTEGGGMDTSAPQTFTFTLTPVNDAPSFTVGDEVTVNEDAGPQSIVSFASDFDPGPNEDGESTQTTVIHDEGADGTADPLSADNNNPTDVGQLFQGSNIVRGHIEDAKAVGNVDVFTFTIDPGFQLDGLFVLEYEYVLPPSNPNERNAFLAIDDTDSFPYNAFELDINDNPLLDESLFIGGTVFGLDDLPNVGGGDILPRAGVITGSRFTPPLPAGTYTIYIQQTGPANTYSLDFRVTSTDKQVVDEYTVSDLSDPTLFASPPQINDSGTLTFTPADDANGTATFNVAVVDSGGTDDGGVNTSSTMVGTITVNSVNDAPTFTASDPPTIQANAGPQTVSGFISDFDPGPNESDQTIVARNVTTVSNPILFAVPPSINASGDLVYTPAANAIGTSTFDVTVQDSGGTDGGGQNVSDPQTFTITVMADLDFGDAPTPYPVEIADDGARHILGPLFLGTTVDFEADGQPSTSADADGEDEDGVTFLSAIVSSDTESTTASVRVVSSEAGFLDAWIDFDGDGSWDDANEQIVISTSLSAGENFISFSVPAGAASGTTAARFRLSSSGGLTPTGIAADGEVEDYLVMILDGGDTPTATVQLVDATTTLMIANGQLIVGSSSGDLFAAPIGELGTLEINGTDADETLTLDVSGGDVLPSGGLTIDGGGGQNTLRIVGDDSSHDFASGSLLNAQNISTIDLSHTGANEITVDASAISTFAPATTLLVVGGEDDTILFADANDWRMGDPSVVDGRFIRSIDNVAGGGESFRTDLPHAWQNVVRAGDVNNSGDVTSGDALVIINELGRRLFSDGSTQNLNDPLSVSPWPGVYYDQSGDDRVTSLDALRVINELGRISLGGGESEPLSVDRALDELVATDEIELVVDDLAEAVLPRRLTRIAFFPTPEDQGPQASSLSARDDRAEIASRAVADGPAVDELFSDRG